MGREGELIIDHLGVNADLCVVSLETAEEKLLEISKEKPNGIIISLIDAEKVREVIAFKPEWKDIKVTLIEDLPMDMWLLYNKTNVIYSNGA